tara:strand:+ start:3233 stop:3628 length:396 start_codon:yes stop_codon:yes gene_type:complete
VTPYIHDGPDGQVSIPRLTVNQIIELQAMHWKAERTALVEDMEEAGVESSERLDRLREARQASESVMALMRLPFSIRWCRSIVGLAIAGGETLVESMNPEEASRAALWCLGYDLDDLKPNTEEKGGAEGKG